MPDVLQLSQVVLIYIKVKPVFFLQFSNSLLSIQSGRLDKGIFRISPIHIDIFLLNLRSYLHPMNNPYV